MRIPDWNQTRMRQGQWKSSTLVCFVVFIFANTRRVVCVIKISAVRVRVRVRVAPHTNNMASEALFVPRAVKYACCFFGAHAFLSTW